MFFSPRARAHRRNQAAIVRTRRHTIRNAGADLDAARRDVRAARQRLLSASTAEHVARAQHTAALADRAASRAVRLSVLFPLMLLVVAHLPFALLALIGADTLTRQYWLVVGPSVGLIAVVTAGLIVDAQRTLRSRRRTIRKHLVELHEASEARRAAAAAIRDAEAAFDNAASRLKAAKQR
ncbi:hypothetical protein [Curtobacterium sp. MCSS17_016]|uniref:hypothetical protein n=1 Tax=Curtobacterium sp. MCSS17_016 TaxID=2175644 RepID=UPI000DA9FC94|nr:hypothetical protein [Curtobacterium sp. MCSS17_016]WIE81355.1 hypothetical protein DEJ19_019160 [Curtobacterium sp. MCSS17_016]